MFARLLEFDARSGDKVAHGGGHKHLPWLGGGGDARADVYHETSDLAVDKLALARVESGPQLDVQRARLFNQLECARDRPGGTVK